MAVSDYLQFENPGVVAIALGLLLFVVAFKVLQKTRIERGPAVLISFIIGIIAVWYLYRTGMIYDAGFLSGAFVVLALGILFVIIRAFYKFGRRSFG